MKTQMYDVPREAWLIEPVKGSWHRPRPEKHRLVGETSRSWLTGGHYPWNTFKYAKRENLIIPEEEALVILWELEHREKLAKEIENGQHPAAILRQIAALIGYKEGA